MLVFTSHVDSSPRCVDSSPWCLDSSPWCVDFSLRGVWTHPRGVWTPAGGVWTPPRIRLVSVRLFQKPGEADSGSLKEPGTPGPPKHLDGHGAVGQSELPPQSPHPRVRKAAVPGRGWSSLRAQGPPFPVVLTGCVTLCKSRCLSRHCGVNL